MQILADNTRTVEPWNDRYRTSSRAIRIVATLPCFQWSNCA